MVSVLGLPSPEAVKLTQLSQESENFKISITDGNLDMFTGIRDYYTLLIISSTDPKHKCQPCMNLGKVIDIVSKSWFHDYLFTNGLFFVEIDLIHQDNYKLASAIKLQTIPQIWLVPPNLEEKYDPLALLTESHFNFNLPVGDIKSQAFAIAQFLSETLQKSIYIRDENPANNFIFYFIITFCSITLLKRRGPKVITNLGKKGAYWALSIFAILVSTTGFQFTRIRKIPFVARNENGIIFISGGSHYQFGVEVVIMSGLYLILALSIISLIKVGNYSSKALDTKQRLMLIILNVCITYLLYSTLTSIVLRKDPEYPFSFTKLF